MQAETEEIIEILEIVEIEVYVREGRPVPHAHRYPIPNTHPYHT